VTEPAVPLAGGGGLVRLRIDLGYDGTAFAGWAVQPGLRTVQGELESALATVLRQPAVRVACAGRTDAGVHARGQVVHVDVPATAYDAQGGDHALGRRLAGLLPVDIGVRAVRQAPDGFDARFSPLWRRYAYRVSDDPFGPDPLRRHDVLAHRRALDVNAMHEAARGLEGVHDFAAFCRQREGATTVRTLLELRWAREDDLVVATVIADAFCHSMVRALVGASLAVGEGRRDVAWPAQVLAGGQRVPDVLVAAAHGLTLEEVRYPSDDELADRAVATRRRRMTPTEDAS
jgi:tRNA pseudouridine38-40 synthase